MIGGVLASTTSGDGVFNLSLCLLWDAIGGEYADAVSRYLTLEMEEKWVDDSVVL